MFNDHSVKTIVNGSQFHDVYQYQQQQEPQDEQPQEEQPQDVPHEQHVPLEQLEDLVVQLQRLPQQEPHVDVRHQEFRHADVNILI